MVALQMLLGNLFLTINFISCNHFKCNLPFYIYNYMLNEWANSAHFTLEARCIDWRCPISLRETCTMKSESGPRVNIRILFFSFIIYFYFYNSNWKGEIFILKNNDMILLFIYFNLEQLRSMKFLVNKI